MPTKFSTTTAIDLPPQSRITDMYAAPNLADAFSIPLPEGASGDPELMARFILSHQPSWIATLTKVRDIVVAGCGLKTAKKLATLGADGQPDRLGIFRIYSSDAAEIVFGEDDRHLDFRASLLCLAAATAGGDRQLVITTVVHCHGRLGRAYLFVIAPFHRLVVKASLVRAARMGWPRRHA
jgi:hypothetical protein